LAAHASPSKLGQKKAKLTIIILIIVVSPYFDSRISILYGMTLEGDHFTILVRCYTTCVVCHLGQGKVFHVVRPLKGGGFVFPRAKILFALLGQRRARRRLGQLRKFSTVPLRGRIAAARILTLRCPNLFVGYVSISLLTRPQALNPRTSLRSETDFRYIIGAG
jgi:hypothetical protein